MVSSVSVPSVEKAEAIGVKCAFLFITPKAPVINRLAGTIDLGEIQPLIGGEFACGISQHAVGKILLFVGQP